MLIIALSTCAFVILGIFGAYLLMFRPQSAAAQRLRQLELGPPTRRVSAAKAGAGVVSVEHDGPSAFAEFAERISMPLNRIVPLSAIKAKKLQQQLMQAGFHSTSASVFYRAIEVLLLVALPAITYMLCIAFDTEPRGTLFCLISSALAAFMLPLYVLKNMIARRQQLIRWGLADALDLMVISIEAGLGLNAAIVRVSDELKKVHPDISKEFELANLEIQVGRDRDEALRNMAERTGVDDLRSLVAMLIQSDKFGTSIARAIRVYSDSLRTKRRQRAEQAAQKAAVKLLFPLAFFLFPTLFIAILGPAAINLIDTFGNM
jgi:tight adherence protein C